MSQQRLGFFRRLWLAFILPWKLVFNGVFAAQVRGLIEAERAERQGPQAAPQPQAPTAPPEPTTALQMLAILQREGRFIDFLQEDVASFSDADVGAAARVVHEGCKRALNEYVELEAVRQEAEGEPIVLEQGFDATRVRLTGNVSGEPPFRGRLAHHGWQVTKIQLPTLTDGHDPKVVAPAEVEL